MQISTTAKIEIDTQAVSDEMRRRGRVFLDNFGQYVVEDAKASIKRSINGESSEPGEPPKSHTGLLQEGIDYAVEGESLEATIGALTWSNRRGENIPYILEHGGRVVRRFARFEAEAYAKRSIQAATSIAWTYTTKAAWRSGGAGKVAATVLIVARPFIKPALDRALLDAARFWEKTVDG